MTTIPLSHLSFMIRITTLRMNDYFDITFRKAASMKPPANLKNRVTQKWKNCVISLNGEYTHGKI